MTLSESLQQSRFHLLVTMLLLGGLYADIVQGMVSDWYHDGNYSHGFLVPVIAGYFLYRRRDELKTARSVSSNLGLVVIVLALVLLIAASLASEQFSLRASLVMLISGMVLFFYGAEVFRITRLPLLYLLFMVPLPYIVYDALAFPLKQLVTVIAVGTLKAAGIAVLREGNIIVFPSITLEVADACSGIRSLVSLLALGTAQAFILGITPLKRWIMILAAVPIAILANALRVIVTGILSQRWGNAAAEGFFHEFAGMAVFVLAMALLITVGAVLRGRDS